jgi:putative ABC transport system permease protein
MRLAWRNLRYERTRFAVTLCGIAFSVFLMVFQGSLLCGFIRSASRVIDVSDAQLWIAAKGVPCFECATPVPVRFREIAMGTPGVAAVQRVITGAAVWKKPSGKGQLVYIIGSEPGIGGKFPLPYVRGGDGPVRPEMVLLDQSNAELLEVAYAGIDVEINRRRARVADIVTDFGSFIGQPYMFTNYKDAVRYLNLGSENVHFLAVHAAPGTDLRQLQAELQRRLPEVNVWLRNEFSRKAQTYWTMLTGAGSAILTAAFLGFLVGTVVVSQTIYATTMENLEEFATLKAMGAARSYIQRVVLAQAWISGLIGSFIGIAITIPLVDFIRSSISWVYMPWWLPAGMILVSLFMCSMAAMVSVRKAVNVEPAKVFRA